MHYTYIYYKHYMRTYKKLGSSPPSLLWEKTTDDRPSRIYRVGNRGSRDPMSMNVL